MRQLNPHASSALVTGCAGFLGSHLCEELIARGHSVTGVDCFTGYYSPRVKQANILSLRRHATFRFVNADLAVVPLAALLDGVQAVFHLAAQPGVRRSFGSDLPVYLDRNVTATQRLLEAAGGQQLDAFVYASSSSVYGDQSFFPIAESAPLRPLSPYGATKVMTEQLASIFWRARDVPVVGLRYFTVYGPRQRPDMAFARFLGCAARGRPLPVLGDGHQVRQFTYVDDAIEATIAAAEYGERGSVYNIGGGQPASVLESIALLEQLLGRRLEIDHLRAGVGDPRRTEADIGRAVRDLGYRPQTPLEEGLKAQLESLQETLMLGAVA